MNGQRSAHEVVGHGIGIRIKDHHGGLGGLDRRMDQDIVPGFLREGPEFLLLKQLCRFFLRGPVDGMVFIVHPFMKCMIEGFQGRVLLHGIEEYFPKGSDGPLHAAFLVPRARIAQPDLYVVMTRELQETRIILDLRSAL